MKTKWNHQKFWEKNKVIITSGVCLLAIVGLVGAGMYFNEEPDMTIDLSPTPISFAIPTLPLSNNVSNKENEATKAPTPTKAVAKAEPTKPLVTEKVVEKDPTPTSVIEKEPEVTEPEEVAAVSAEALASLNFNVDAGLNWPVFGEVALEFSVDHGIYHETLKSFRTNDGVLLSADAGTHVVAAMDGIVTEIVEDTMRGTCVTVAIGNGYEITYGQLSELECEVGDELAEGDRIGNVAAPTKYYSLEGAHLYFKVASEGNAINPLLLLRNEEE